MKESDSTLGRNINLASNSRILSLNDIDNHHNQVSQIEESKNILQQTAVNAYIINRFKKWQESNSHTDIKRVNVLVQAGTEVSSSESISKNYSDLWSTPNFNSKNSSLKTSGDSTDEDSIKGDLFKFINKAVDRLIQLVL
jgi:hypothetical protein